jgi:hypothetical protein
MDVVSQKNQTPDPNVSSPPRHPHIFKTKRAFQNAALSPFSLGHAAHCPVDDETETPAVAPRRAVRGPMLRPGCAARALAGPDHMGKNGGTNLVQL